jgi:hypothetical protein
MKELEDIKVPLRVKLAVLWASLMHCYIYGDYFGLYVPGKLQRMLDGIGPFGPTTQGMLLTTAALLAIPAVMVFLVVILKPAINRWMNIGLGIFYTLIMLMTMPGSWTFYIFLGIIEILLSIAIVWYAWKWPKVEV